MVCIIAYHTGGSEIWSDKLPDVRFVLYLTIQEVLRFGLTSSLMWGLYYILHYRWFWDLVCQAPWCEVCIISYHTGGSEIWSVKLPDVRFVLYLTIQVVLRFGLSSSLMWGLYYILPYRWFWDLVCQAPWCEVCIITYHTGGSEIWSVKLPDVRFVL